MNEVSCYYFDDKRFLKRSRQFTGVWVGKGGGAGGGGGERGCYRDGLYWSKYCGFFDFFFLRPQLFFYR